MEIDQFGLVLKCFIITTSSSFEWQVFFLGMRIAVWTSTRTSFSLNPLLPSPRSQRRGQSRRGLVSCSLVYIKLHFVKDFLPSTHHCCSPILLSSQAREDEEE